MKTKVTISAFAVQVSISGISIRISRDELFEGLKTLRTVYNNVIPEERKESMIGCGIEEAFNKIEQYQPFAERFLSCWTFEKSATSTITINEDGTIDMHSNEQNAKFDLKAFMQTISDLSTFVEKEEDHEQEKADKQVTTITMNVKSPTVSDLLYSTEDYPALNHEARILFRNTDPHSFLYSFQLEQFNEAIKSQHVRYVVEVLAKEQDPQLVKTYLTPGATIGQFLNSLAAHELIVGQIGTIFKDLNLDDIVSHDFLETVNIELEQHGYEYAFDGYKEVNSKVFNEEETE